MHIMVNQGWAGNLPEPVSSQRNSGNPPFLSKTPTSTLFFPAIGAKFECRRSEITRLSEHSESFWT